ncbi:chloride channel protein [Alloprevotella sp. OH1205_COT-284]|uniref:chloride channel protein n=1 Tax=Alloprevotella sp. OH1205_COT-284 TaxID=2491043 RepID=UPI000F5DD190|nr:chloride channel protein [Alloprevotella sp. OH1205_COT-284]RRD79820.1 chloride channel protein [Alloprevotella sp. OH1205_COT-284]
MLGIQQKLTQRQFVLLLSLCVGLASGLAANLLKWFIHSVEEFLTRNFTVDSSNPLYLLYPAVGILLSALFIKYIVRDNIGHGVTKILYALSRNQGFLRSHNTWSSMVASGLTIGFGGSVGAESPIVLTGSALGSRIGRWFDLDHRTLMILVGCGASGAVAGIFKAPIAGLVFTIEVLMIDLTMSSLVPLLISCASAACVSYFLSGSGTMFHIALNDPFIVERVPSTILLGVLCGLIGLYFTRVMNAFERVFARFGNLYVRWIMGGMVLALLIYLFPPLYGEGYGTISTLLNSTTTGDAVDVMNNSLFYGHERWILLYLGLIILLKVFAATATNGGGGCGGTFAPSLFLGCLTGYTFSQVWNQFAPFGITLPPTNSCLYGMAGVMSAVFHAPLTGIFLIAELTGGYRLLVPLMIVSAISYLVIHTFEPHSIYSMRLARRGELLTHHKDQSVLTLMNLEDVTDKSRPILSPDMTLGKMLQLVSSSKRLHFAVCSPDKKLLAVVNINNIRHLIFRSELYNSFTVNGLMSQPHAIVRTDDSMQDIMDKFQKNDAGTLPVTDADGYYVGFVSQARLYSAYREILKDFSEE